MSKICKDDTLENELNKTRIRLYEQTKNMTTKERVLFINKGAKAILESHGIKVNFAEPLSAQAQSPPKGTSYFRPS